MEEFDRLVGANEWTFYESLYVQFTSKLATCQKPQDVLEQAITKLNKMQHVLELSSAVVLQDTGVGKELEVVHRKLRRVCSVKREVEAMLCEAMIDPQDLVAAYQRKQLSYQRT